MSEYKLLFLNYFDTLTLDTLVGGIMARIAGIELPAGKRVEAALTYIFGIGFPTSRKILTQTGVKPDTRVKDLTENEIVSLRNVIEREYKIEGDLRREISMNIKRLIDIKAYRGVRHLRNLPVRGQRTRTNARTRKGPKKTVGTLKGKARESLTEEEEK